MKASTQKTLKTALPLLLGVFLIWLSLSKLTTDEINQIKDSFYNANYWWIGLSLVIGALSHLSRAYRWKFMLNPLGYQPKFQNSAMAVFIAYLVNMGIPRAGEVSRAATINQYEGVPFEKAFGTIVAERLADMIVYLFLIALAFIAQYQLISKLLLSKIPENPILLIGIVSVIVLGIYLFFRATKKSQNPFFKKLRSFAAGLYEGIQTILTMEKKWAFIGHTLFIWLAYIMMLYVVIFALPETTNIGFGAILTCFVMGTFAFATTNGGIGSYPYIIQQTLLLYAVPMGVGASFGWIMWTSQTLLVIILGGLSFLLLPLLNKSR
ncbi:lysylphosphatidylglycerol synthase transmembrane domain-containing protein [Wenyingzhuangia aestuarii]|uniref:lysylphosphatidylglycerol synthase transmembrane domain-containing protein n=1 Tax=Wenyingzhuangia aestuarii TaxID=1647582 RepID=UPI00143A279D|nr:lysylphosphatidylglycerol synthase transmembrane domain-containing protein [Wenyingzhuangia aestuarii]NJB82004.1 hypothetical protein [Wenyingzhuangia aestuarii]